MRSFLLALITLALLPLAGCDSTEAPVSASLLPDDARYAWSMESRLVETDSLIFREEDGVRVRVVSRDASVPGYRNLTEVYVSMLSGPWADSVGSRTWYEQTSEQLRGVAYAGAGRAVLASPRGSGRVSVSDPVSQPYLVTEALRRAGVARGDCCDPDSVIVRDDPRVVYGLPLGVGASWVSFTDPFESTREVVGRETVTVAAGTFDCFVIRTEIDVIDPSREQFEWFDYVSEERGVVLRRIETVQEHRDESNLPTGLLFRTIERLELTNTE